ncbi:aspartate 1-decarboxylase [Campylobacter jejuni]|nr:aspartate 1-decarboxylase [Campylobacter jejuni]ECQ1759442.1 aspartate 1-decarboxylase [Campylobacter jejuni]
MNITLLKSKIHRANITEARYKTALQIKVI